MAKELNGLDLEAVGEIVGQVQKDPSLAEPLNHWSARFRWLGGFRGEAIIGNHAFLVDEPSDLAGKNTAPNAVEYLLGAYGACLTGGLCSQRHEARSRRQELRVRPGRQHR